MLSELGERVSNCQRETMFVITLSLFCNIYVSLDFQIFYFFRFILLSLPSSNLGFVLTLSLLTLMVI